MTFTTDFGFRDGYAGAMKGVVLSMAPHAAVVDITHGIARHDITGGAVALAQAAPLFPAGTIHVAIVDPGVGGGRADLLVQSRESFFIGPDNGVLSLAAPPPRRIYRIEAPSFRREPVSPTFHGRDVFAAAAGRLAAGAGADQAGPAALAMIELNPPLPREVDGYLEGAVAHVDGFGNLITSLVAGWGQVGTAVDLEIEGASFRARWGRTYVDVPPGELIAYLGSSGQLEIAVRDGSAAEVTRASRGSPVRVRCP